MEGSFEAASTALAVTFTRCCGDEVGEPPTLTVREIRTGAAAEADVTEPTAPRDAAAAAARGAAALTSEPPFVVPRTVSVCATSEGVLIDSMSSFVTRRVLT